MRGLLSLGPWARLSETAASPLPFVSGYKVSVMPIRALRELAMMRMSALPAGFGT